MMLLKIFSIDIEKKAIIDLKPNAFQYFFMVLLSYAHVSFIFLQCIFFTILRNKVFITCLIEKNLIATCFYVVGK